MGITIRLVDAEERVRLVRPLTGYAFESSPRDDDMELLRRRMSVGSRRTHVAFDGDDPRCTATVIEMTQNVRGALLPMGAVAAVATHPAARRQGLARDMLRHILADMREQGQVVSTLYPFRPSFYERFGYTGLPPERRASLTPADLAPLLRVPVPGTVELVRYPDAAAEVRGLTEALLPEVHGMALRADPGLADARGETQHWAAVARVDGEVTGYLAYRVEEYGGQLTAWRFLYRDPAARTLLLGWLARHVDQVSTVSLPLRPVDRPETWATDLTLTVQGRSEPYANAPMGRVLSVPGLTGIGAGDGEVTVRVTDDVVGGVYTLTGAGGALSVKVEGDTGPAAPAGDPASRPYAELTGHGLAALVYGVLDPAELYLRGYGTVDAAAAEQLRALFPLQAPFLLEAF
ncbi:MAG: GNAT family N-acetyltransferase [Actinocatenispora sp.]